jgi:precorrin-6B methylase 2
MDLAQYLLDTEQHDSRRSKVTDRSEIQLKAAALALGARSTPDWSDEEEDLVRNVPRLKPSAVELLRRRIVQGFDPLGDAFCQLRSAADRRNQGATYTPKKIVKAMISWARKSANPTRIVDPGTGSGRFLIEAGRIFKQAQLMGAETDPLAAMISRANLAVLGMAHRAQVVLCDYRSFALPPFDGETLFIGNPPYVRHHQIDSRWKNWLAEQARLLNLSASQLAGLHVYFYLSTALKAKRGDRGSFITSAEWLDVNYGKLLRDLFLGRLGGQSIVIVEPEARPFPDAATTAAITTFEFGSQPTSILMKRIADTNALKPMEGGRRIRRERLESEFRWSHFTRGPQEKREGFVELGELCRVHRGQVTGLNRAWIEGPHCTGLPQSVLFPTVTRARELFLANGLLKDASGLRRVVDLPVDLNRFDARERRRINAFLESVRSIGAHAGYIAKNRKAWWSVGLRMPAPILATYMARRPPAFVLNTAQARHLNIAHGLYPREPMTSHTMSVLVSYLSKCVNPSDGRTYAGGLTKFEPREMERILIPGPEFLSVHAA